MQVTPGGDEAAEGLCLAVWSAALERRPATTRGERPVMPGGGSGRVCPVLLTVTQYSAV